MDVEGVEPRSEAGKHFRANCWSWRPIWEYACAVGGVDDEKRNACHFNDGAGLNGSGARALGEKLAALDESGELGRHIDAERRRREEMPDEKCNLCAGTGTRTDMVVRDGCNKCAGKGSVRPDDTHYSFSLEHMREFVAFLKDCGGFRVC
jgi:hypothetical protein